MQSFTTTNILRRAEQVRVTLNQEPRIVPDFAAADLETIAAVIYCLLFQGINTKTALNRYLSGRNCRLAANDISFILAIFEDSNTNSCLWTREHGGIYDPVLAAAPADFDYTADW